VNPVAEQHARVLSGMRPTGRLHLGHYHGVLKNWVNLQHEYDCFFFVADWHALTTHYDNPSIIPESVHEMVIDWLAAGVDPARARIFIQSQVAEHAELHLLLSMITPLGWLERVPTYKDQQQHLKEKDLATYGFLGYPLLQSADILIYRAGLVPVGEDQVVHVEMTREVARRFNHLYGREADFAAKAEAAARKMGKKNARAYGKYRAAYQEGGDTEALQAARRLLESQQNITVEERERLLGYLEGGGRIILPEPQPLLTRAARMPGLDGRKMAKSYGNAIALRDDPGRVEQKLRTMPTDTNRVRRTDPGDPARCPLWPFHEVYSSEETMAWVQEGCKSAGIGCIDCKQPVIEAVLSELEPMQQKAAEYEARPDLLREVIRQGCDAARDSARETLSEVRQAMSLSYD
jgi:tryptophanyl-tRNA synthetase